MMIKIKLFEYEPFKRSYIESSFAYINKQYICSISKFGDTDLFKVVMGDLKGTTYITNNINDLLA